MLRSLCVSQMMGGSTTMGGFGSEGGGMGMSQGMGATPTKQGVSHANAAALLHQL